MRKGLMIETIFSTHGFLDIFKAKKQRISKISEHVSQ